MPTDFTNPFVKSVFDKDLMTKSVVLSTKRSRMIETVESKIAKDPRVIVLREVTSIVDPKSGTGVTVRDISQLMDGNYYRPGTATLSFFETKNPAFAKQALQDDGLMQGQAQALLILRFGLQ